VDLVITAQRPLPAQHFHLYRQRPRRVLDLELFPQRPGTRHFGRRAAVATYLYLLHRRAWHPCKRLGRLGWELVELLVRAGRCVRQRNRRQCQSERQLRFGQCGYVWVS